MKNFFSTVDKITYEGSSSSNRFSFKHAIGITSFGQVQIHLVGTLLKGLGLVIL